MKNSLPKTPKEKRRGIHNGITKRYNCSNRHTKKEELQQRNLPSTVSRVEWGFDRTKNDTPLNKKSAESDVAPAGIKSYKFLFVLKKFYFAVFKKLIG